MKPLLLAVCIAAVAVSSCGGGNKGSGGGGGGGGTGPGTTPTPVPTPAPTPAPTPVPTVTSIAPTSGMAAGGTQVTIAGTNFASGATVTIGTVALTSVSVTATAITGTTGASSTAGPANVTVSNPGGGGSATLQNGFTYQSLPRAVISGGLSVVQHNTNVTLSGQRRRRHRRTNQIGTPGIVARMPPRTAPDAKSRTTRRRRSITGDAAFRAVRPVRPVTSAPTPSR